MNLKSKKVLAGAAVAGVLVTWIPQLVAARDDAPVHTPLGAAVQGELVVESEGRTPDDASSTDPASTGAPDDVTRAVDPALALDQRLDAVKAFLPERTQRDLDVLAAAWSLEIEEHKPHSDSDPAGGIESVRPPLIVVPVDAGTEASHPTQREDPPETDPLEAFLAANPLTGVLYGDDMRFANLGASVVREGDDVFGIARVESIGPRWIVLERGSRHVRVDLVPLTARAKAAATGNTNGSPPTPGGTTGAANSGVAPTGTTGTAPVPGVGTAAQDLAAVLSGMQQALGTLGAAGTSDTKDRAKDEKGKKP